MADPKRQPVQGVVYLSVSGDDLVKLIPTIKEQLGWDVPYPKMTSAEICIVDGKIIGLSLVSLQPSMGPLWVAPNYRGTGVAEHLADRSIQTAQQAGMKQYVVQTKSDTVRKICRERGFVDKGEYTVLVKE